MSKRTVVRLIALGLSVILCVGLLLTAASLSAGLVGADIAELWAQGDTEYIDLSCFISKRLAVNSDMILNVRHSIDSALVTDSIQAENENARLWIDAYSAETNVIAVNDDNSSNVRAICTGGDFFTFNPIKMMTGWYYSEADIMEDSVILDKNAAWQLFGGYDLEGMSIELNGVRCLIVGVSDFPENDAQNEAYGSEPLIYIPYSLCAKLGIMPEITNYEALLPNPVKDYAEKIFTDNLGFEENEREVCVTSGRFSVASNLTRVADIGHRAQRTTEVYFPWWENGARYIESWCTVLTVIAALLAIYPLVLAVIYIVKGIKHRKEVFKAVSGFFGRLGNKKEKKQKLLEDTYEK